MKMKKIISLLMAVALTAGLSAGCGKHSDKEGEKDGNVSAKGRYVEQEIALPEGAEEAVGIINQENELKLYTQNESGYHIYSYQNETWADLGDVAWMTDARDRLGLPIEHIYLGKDGGIYGMAIPASEDVPYGQHILKDAGDGTAQDCTPGPCLEVNEEGWTELIVDMAVMGNGTMILANMDGMVQFYKDEKKVSEMPQPVPVLSDHQNVMGISDQSIAIFGKNRKSIDFYDIENLEKTKAVEVKQELEESMLVPAEDGIWYLVNSKGIQRITEQGSIVETVMDGTGVLMSMDSAYLISFLCGNDNEFYGLYSISGGGERLMCYQYDENVKAVRDETLSIYGLKENQTVSQAIYVFQSMHPEVKVDYHTAKGSEDTPASEAIRTLNAELLNKGGADVLILDGLPITSYMEKGILMDLSDLADRLSQKGVLMNVVGNAALLSEKIYAIPARVSLPVIFGEDAKADACQNPDAFHSYLEKNPTERLFGTTTHDLAGMTLFNTFYEDLMNEQGGLDEEKLAQFLDDWMKLCEIQNTGVIEEEFMSGVWNQMNTRFSSGMGLRNDPVMIEEINGLISTMVPYTLARDSAKMPESLKQYYIPQVIAGINASSKQQDLAAEFIECLFVEDVQKADNSDGFPVLKSALSYMAEYVETSEAQNLSISTGARNPETGEDVQIGAMYPVRDEVEGLIQMIEGLNVPFMMDDMVANTVLMEMENCYSKKQSVEETAKAICQKVDTYLAE